jgi:HlyD family secretion protein
MAADDDPTSAFRLMAEARYQQMVAQAETRQPATVQARDVAEPAGPRGSVDRRMAFSDVIEGSFRPLAGKRANIRRLSLSAIITVPVLVALLAGCARVSSSGPTPLPTLAPLGKISPSGSPNSSAPSAGAALTGTPYTVAVGDVQASVIATGEIVAQRQAQLAFTQVSQVTKVDVTLGQAVKAGDVLVELAPVVSGSSTDGSRSDSLSGVVSRAQLQLAVDDAKMRQAQAGSSADAGRARITAAQAQAKVDADQAALDKLQAGPDANDVAAAKAVLEQQKAKLAALTAGPQPAQRDLLQKQVDAAKNGLLAAQAARDGACNKSNPDYMCTAGNANVNQAQTALDAAQKQFQIATSGPSPQDLQQAQQAVAEAQAKYDAARSGPSPSQIQQAQSQLKADQLALQLAGAPASGASQGDVAVLQAQRALDALTLQQAQADLAAAQQTTNGQPEATRNMVAPFDGIVAGLNAHLGDVGQVGTVAVVVADPGTKQIVASVADADLGKVAVGQTAQLSLARSPDDGFTGQVQNITRVASTQGDKVVYPVTIGLDPKMAAKADLGAGVRVRIVTAAENHVMLVPNQYVQRDNGQAFVQKLVDSGTTQVPVVTGLVGADSTQILQGLAPGDRVVLAPVPAHG